MITSLKSVIITLRQTKPLVLCLTNNVTTEFVANVLLAIGAAPIMSSCEEEFEDLIKMSHAIYINIGTLDEKSIAQYKIATRLAKQYKKPIVLDPVGAGATYIRTKISRELIPDVDIIKGNASEIMSLVSDNSKTLGVESTLETKNVKNNIVNCAKELKTILAVTGAEDIITDGEVHTSLNFGSPLMQNVTGMGCALGAVVAAFKAIESNAFEASKLALAYYSLCGNLAASKVDKPGSFQTYFIDELYSANFKDMEKFF